MTYNEYRWSAEWLQVADNKIKSKGLPQQGKAAQGVRGSLRPRIFLTFRHYKGGGSSAIRTAGRRNP